MPMAFPTDWIDEFSAAWRREYPHHDTSVLVPIARLARLGNLIQQFQAQVLEPFELTPGDYGVLAALRRTGEPYAASPSQLYSLLERSSGGMTKMLKRLEERGLVRRGPDPEDGRGSRVYLTEAGQDVQAQVFDAFLVACQDVLADLPAAKLKEADRSLRTLLEAFEGHFYV